MTELNKNRRTMAVPAFFRKRRARRPRRLITTKPRRGTRTTRARKPAPVSNQPRIPNTINPAPKRPREFKSLRFESFNCEGLSPHSREEIIIMMKQDKVDVLLLQETWTEEPQARTVTPDGFLFLLHGTRKPPQGRNSCGVGFVLSPSAVDAWEKAGASFHTHPSSDHRARFASIRLAVKEKTGPKVVTFFALSAYLPDQSHKDHPLATALDDLGQEIDCAQTGDVLIAGMDANVQLGTSTKYNGNGDEGGGNPVGGTSRSLSRVREGENNGRIYGILQIKRY